MVDFYKTAGVLRDKIYMRRKLMQFLIDCNWFVRVWPPLSRNAYLKLVVIIYLMPRSIIITSTLRRKKRKMHALHGLYNSVSPTNAFLFFMSHQDMSHRLIINFHVSSPFLESCTFINFRIDDSCLLIPDILFVGQKNVKCQNPPELIKNYSQILHVRDS